MEIAVQIIRLGKGDGKNPLINNQSDGNNLLNWMS